MASLTPLSHARPCSPEDSRWQVLEAVARGLTEGVKKLARNADGDFTPNRKAMSLIGYARVSTTEQNTDTQVEQLSAAGCDVVRQEKVSGRSREGRTELERILDFIRPGDTLWW